MYFVIIQTKYIKLLHKLICDKADTMMITKNVFFRQTKNKYMKGTASRIICYNTDTTILQEMYFVVIQIKYMKATAQAYM